MLEELTINKEITNFSQLLASNIKDKKIVPKGDSVLLEIERLSLVEGTDKYFGVATAIADKLYPEILLYKTKIIPYMTRLSNFFKEKSTYIKGVNEALEYRVVSAVMPELVNNLLEGEFSKIGGEIIDLYNENDVSIPYEDVRNLFKFTNSTSNIYLEEIMKNKTSDELLDIYGKYLTGISKFNSSIKELYNTSLNSLINVETIVLIIAALDNKLHGGGVINNDEERILTYYLHNLIIVLKKIQEHYKTVNQIELVILYTNDKTIYVSDENYKLFLQNGGTPDTVLGWYIEGENGIDLTKRTVKYLLANKEQYEKSWEKFVNFSKLTLLDDLAENLRSTLLLEFNKVWNDYVPDDLKDEIDYETAREGYNVILNECGEMILKPAQLSRILMTDLFFRHTNFKLFSTLMQKYLEADNSINYNDAATFTVIDMVITYLSNQFDIV